MKKNIPIGDYNFKVSYIRWKEKNRSSKYYYYFLNDEKKQVFRKHTSFNNKAVDFHHSLYIEATYFDNFNATKEDNPTFDFSVKTKQILHLETL